MPSGPVREKAPGASGAITCSPSTEREAMNPNRRLPMVNTSGPVETSTAFSSSFTRSGPGASLRLTSEPY